MEEYYLVTLSTGDWEGISYQDIFITDKEYKAKFYCSKGNAILLKYKSFYIKRRDRISKSKKLNGYCEAADRVDLTTGQFFYKKIQFRSNININK